MYSGAVMAILFIYFFICLHAGVKSTSEQQCPSDKPYHSDVGCIFECPEPFYINDTNCVTHCGDWLVDESRNCVEHCPNNTFYEENLKQVQSGQYLERKCVECNEYNQFIFNGMCVKVCPADSRYIDRQNCVNECPAERPYKSNMTLFHLRHYKCVEKCPYLVDANFCMDDCPKKKVVFNSSCVGQCPSSAPFLLSKSCATECPKYAPSAGYENKTCLKHRCPDERSYVLNNICVEICSETEPLVFSTYNGDIGFNHCVENCKDGQYRLNDQCVDKCPSLTVAINDSCHKQCPVQSPFSCVISKGLECGEKLNKDLKHAVCVDDCPSSMLTWNKTCVFSCPSGIAVFGKECVEKCPSDYPFQRNITTSKGCMYERCRKSEIVLSCVKECPSDTYIFNNTCLSYCQSPLLHKDNECVFQCPATKPFILNSKLVLTIWSFDKYAYDDRKYRQVRKDIAIQKCTSSCGRKVSFNSTCMKSCPEDFTFIHNGTCSQQKCDNQYSESATAGFVCLDECKNYQLVFNRTCIESCPDSYKSFNGTCVEQCPKSHNFSGISVQGKTCDYHQNCFAENILLNNCVETCPGDFYLYKSTCLSFCHRPLFTFDNICVEYCPKSAPYSEASSVIVENWNSDGNKFRKISSIEYIIKCVTVCDRSKVLSGSKCVESCPAKLRFIRNETCGSEPCTENYKYFSSTGIRCFDECPKDLFVLNGTCILHCPDDLFIWGQNCVTTCPQTDKLIHEASINKYKNICTDGYNRYRDTMCSQSIKHVKICQNRCPENKFQHNNTCLDFCPESTYILNRTCVVTCPITHQFVQPATTTAEIWTESYRGAWYLITKNLEVKKCVRMCSGTFRKFGYNCYYTCPGDAPFVDDTTCVKKCPEDKLLDDVTNSCVDRCASDRGLINKTCHFNCPSNVRYIHDSLCVSECPSSAPVALKEDRFICRKSCADDKLFKPKEEKCVYHSECDEPMFEYGVLCISSCPEGFVWFFSCTKTLWAVIAIPVIFIVFIAFLTCSWQNIIDFYRVSRLMFVSEVKLEEIEQQQRHQYLKTVDKRNKADDEISLSEMFFETDNGNKFPRQIDSIAEDIAVASETEL